MAATRARGMLCDLRLVLQWVEALDRAGRQANGTLMVPIGFERVAPLLRKRYESARKASNNLPAALCLKPAGAFTYFTKEMAMAIVADAASLTDKEGKALLRAAQGILEPPKQKKQ